MVEGIEDGLRLTGRLVGGRFVVVRAVAQGGSGIVYRAEHAVLGTPVALKLLRVADHRLADTAARLTRFRQEALTLARLAHPAVVRVLDVGHGDGGAEAYVWIAMEWLDGVTLDEHLRADGGRARSPRQTLALLSPVLDAIAHAHALGFAHRDLKPTNLMAMPLAHHDVALRVLDFGIAKAMAPDESPGTGLTETQSDLSAFSLPYAAPEQVGRVRTGPWTDVHALGLLLTEVLVGRPAYAPGDSFARYAAVMAPQRPTPGRLGVEVGPWEPILARALALHPAERFPTAGALYDALRASVDAAQRSWEHPLPGAPAGLRGPWLPRAARALAPGLTLPLVGLAAWALASAPAPPTAAPVALLHPVPAALSPRASRSAPEPSAPSSRRAPPGVASSTALAAPAAPAAPPTAPAAVGHARHPRRRATGLAHAAPPAGAVGAPVGSPPRPPDEIVME